jgi:alpha-beta hydrolase superfamily lysophospholipase
MAYLGDSLGGQLGPIFLAVETRFQAAILYSGGFLPWPVPPEATALNFAPRVKVPVLMLNSRYDDVFPLESSQLPLFHLLGTPEKDKKHVVYEGGHGDLPPRQTIRETLDWLDKYLGPVRRN